MHVLELANGRHEGTLHEEELDRLAALHAAGLAVAPVMLVPPSSEEAFYRYGNLVRQLHRLFGRVDPADPDEDDLEELAPRAMELVTGSYLLDEVIDEFYETVAQLPEQRRVRRPGSAGLEARGPRGSLLALKRTWADDWSFGVLSRRLPASGSFGLAARPVLVHAADRPAGDRTLRGRVREVLGLDVPVFVTQDGSISRLAP